MYSQINPMTESGPGPKSSLYANGRRNVRVVMVTMIARGDKLRYVFFAIDGFHVFVSKIFKVNQLVTEQISYRIMGGSFLVRW